MSALIHIELKGINKGQRDAISNETHLEKINDSF